MAAPRGDRPRSGRHGGAEALLRERRLAEFGQRQASPAGAHLRIRAGRVQAMLGTSWATTLGLTRRALCRCPKEDAAPFPFVLANGGGDSISVEVVRTTDSFSELVEFLDDRIPALHDGLLAGSSSGVQMIGGLEPTERQTLSIVPRIVALARCLQFHVNSSTWTRSQVADDAGFDIDR